MERGDATSAIAAETVAFVPLAFDPPPAAHTQRPRHLRSPRTSRRFLVSPQFPLRTPHRHRTTPSTPPPSAQPADFAPVPGYTPTPAAYTPPVSSYTPPAASYAPAPAAYTPGTAYPAKKSNTLIKVLVALVLIIFVGGALAVGGLWYASPTDQGKSG